MTNIVNLTNKKDNIESRVLELLKETTFKNNHDQIKYADTEEIIMFGLDLVLKTLSKLKDSISELKDSVDTLDLRIDDIETDISTLYDLEGVEFEEEEKEEETKSELDNDQIVEKENE
jgi:hypothetical protein